MDDPLNQRVLDPACGSGTFVAEAMAQFIAAAGAANWEPKEVLERLREAVTGIDVHPVAVHLARAAWTLAARPAISEASDAGYDASLSIPVYLGDALQLRFRTGDMFAEHQITIQTRDPENTDFGLSREPCSTVQDLRDHMDLFVTPDSNGKARLLNCPPGWECEVTNTKQVAGYGLDDVIELVNPGSGEALEAEIRASFEKEEPVLFYYWGPTTLSNALSSEYGGYTLLEEPPYTAECWDAERNCGYSIAQVLIGMRRDLIDQAPDLVTFFEKWGLQRGQPAGGGGLLRRVGREFCRRRGQVPAEQLGVEELGHLRRGLQG